MIVDTDRAFGKKKILVLLKDKINIFILYNSTTYKISDGPYDIVFNSNTFIKKVTFFILEKSNRESYHSEIKWRHKFVDEA